MTSERAQSKDPTQMILEETERRLDAYYELALPGEEDSPIEPMGARDVYLIAILAAALIALWLIGRFVVLPIYV